MFKIFSWQCDLYIKFLKGLNISLANKQFWKGQIDQRTIKGFIMAKEQLKWFILTNGLLENTKITLETHIFKNYFNYVSRVILVFSSSILAKMSHFNCSLARISLFIVPWPIWPFQNCLLAKMIFNPRIYKKINLKLIYLAIPCSNKKTYLAFLDFFKKAN